ncbi:MAG: GTPase HflX, partial [Candidatus Cloacimonadaceae bacterium]
RRLIRQNIRKIKDALETVTKQKHTQRKMRDSALKICLVGYTNAGKSTLFNLLTDAEVLVEDKLFATLDSTSRQLKLSTGEPVVISDTVGFISRLPHHLVASFKATLMEVQDADLLLHLVDASDEMHDYYIAQVNEVLESIDAHEIPQILVFNKCDLLHEDFIVQLKGRYPDCVLVSAREDIGVLDLLEQVEKELLDARKLTIKLGFDQGSLRSKLHEIATIHSEDYSEDGVEVKLTISARDLHLVSDYIVHNSKD